MRDLLFQFLSLFILSFLVFGIESQSTKWYYTRRFRNDFHPNGVKLFSGSNFNYDDLFHNRTNDQAILFSGGIALLRETDPNALFNNETIYYLMQNTSLIPKQSIGQEISGLSTVQYNLLIINDYANYPNASNNSDLSIMEEEIGLFDHVQNKYIEKKWRYTRLGMALAILVNVTYPSKGNSFYEEHKILASADMAGKPSLSYHTWTTKLLDTPTTELEAVPQIDPNELIKHPIEPVSTELEGEIEDVKRLRIMTYNLWHNNPPSWIYHVRKLRWERYHKRLRLFAENIVKNDPDIITLQEVRVDAAFFSPEGRVFYQDVSGEQSKFDGGSQVEHLLSHLRDAWISAHGIESYPNYQVVYHPAMFMKEREKINIRNEEGLLILSKHPIINSELLLLSREVGNNSDDHQRVVLVAQVEVAHGQQSSLVTVATSHFSLSSEARDRAVQEIKSFFSENEWINLSALQVFTGDLNAEPMEGAITALSSKSDVFHFVDTWTALHEDDQTGFTFPACNPVKRIDYIFAKKNDNICANTSEGDLSCNQNHVKILDSFIIGQDPTEDTKHLVNSREGIGMNDADSPIWASDHFALVTDLALD